MHADNALVMVLERFEIDAFIILADEKEAILPFITDAYKALNFHMFNKMFFTQELSKFVVFKSATGTVLLRFVIDAFVEYNLLQE